MITAALAYGDKALPHNVDPAFRPSYVALEKMFKLSMIQQCFELLCDIVANIIVRVLDFADEFFAAVNDKKNIFQIATPEEIIVAATKKRLQLCCHEQLRRKTFNI
jgi:hypothetical protein